MGIRDFLRERKARFAMTQETMAERIEAAGREIDPKYTLTQGAVSLWLRDKRYPDRLSLQAIHRAFPDVSEKRWREMLWSDMVDETDTRDNRSLKPALRSA